MFYIWLLQINYIDYTENVKRYFIHHEGIKAKLQVLSNFSISFFKTDGN